MNKPKISIIIPVYNVEKYLIRCIDSILMQTYTEFELLLVNDGSSDNSGTICDKYLEKDSRVRVFHKENGGVSSARNFGLNNAKGEWILFVDSDDYVDDNYIESYIKDITNHDRLIIQGCTCVNDTDNTILNILKYPDSVYCDNIVKFINDHEIFKHGSPYGKLYSNKIIQSNKIRFNNEIHNYEDLIFLLDYMQYITEIKLNSNIGYKYVVSSSGLHTRIYLPHNEKLLLDLYIKKIFLFNLKNSKANDYILVLFLRYLKSICVNTTSYSLTDAYYEYKKHINVNTIYLTKKQKILLYFFNRKMFLVIKLFYSCCI